MSDYLYWSAVKIAREIRIGKLTSSETVDSYLARINQVNPAINAAVQITAEMAQKEASDMDQLAGQNKFKGPLHGVPISIKDSLDTAGVISTGGTLGRKHYVPDKDAPVVARLRAAGAVLIAKTNTPELTLSGETNNQIFGRTNNPFDVSRSPGGSSGGSAALVAAGGSALELGSDTGGSIREPAHLCGITGIKPTSGRTPRTGHIVPYAGGALDSLTQIGPMARYVEDLVLSLPIICGPDWEDPTVVPMSFGDPGKIDVSKLRIAFHTDNGVTRPVEDIVRVVGEVAAELDRQNFNIREARMPELPRLIELSTKLRKSANAKLINRLLDRYGTTQPGPDLTGYLDSAQITPEHEIDPYLLESIDEVRSRTLQWMRNYDAIICPPSHAIARPHGASHADSFDDWSYLTIHNLLGWPGLTVRAGTSNEGRLPVGVQIVTAPWREDIALALAYDIEKRFGGFQRPDI